MLIKDNETEQEEPLNMTPLIDMVFLLLIFFLVATTFRQEERELNIQLPGLSSNAPLSAVPTQLIINVDHEGKTIVNGTVYGPKELEELVTQVATRDPSREVLIRADRRATIEPYAEVVSICRRAGVSESKLGFLAEEGGR
jgi:biopolymer transport protein ExbD